MAKRGTFSSLVKRFPPIRRGHWKRHKLLTILANRRQQDREDAAYNPITSPEQEIMAENGYYVLTEVGQYLITE